MSGSWLICVEYFWCICKRLGAQILSLGRATGGLVGGFEGAGGAAQDEEKHPGPWLWQGWPRGAAAAEGGRRVNRLEGTASLMSRTLSRKPGEG